MRKALVPALAIAALALVAGLWLAWRSRAEAPASVPPTVATPTAAPAEAPELAMPAKKPTEARARVADAPAEPARLPRPQAPAHPASAAEEPREPGVLEVLVVGPAGEPVAGASVRVMEARAGPRVGAPQIHGPDTDAEGRSRVLGIPLGTVRAIAEAEGRAAGVSDRVHLTEQRPSAEVEVALTMGGSVEGRLTDVHGEPAAGIPLSIHLRTREGRVNEATTGFLLQTEAGPDGAFLFVHLPAGSYALYTRAQAEDEQRVPRQRLMLDVLEGQTTQAVFPDLRDSHVDLSGLVLRDGAAVEGADVSVTRAERGRGHLGRRVKTDADGLFEVILDGGGEYRFQVSDPELDGSVFRTAHVPGSPFHEVVIAYSTGRISGSVFDPGGAPVAGMALRASGRAAEEGGSTVAWSRTDAGGEYEFPGLLAATYTIYVGVTPPLGRPRSETHPHLDSGYVADLELEPGASLSGVDFTLRAAAALEGLVTDREGLPVGSASVECALAADRNLHRARRTVTDVAGAFELGGVRPGEYRVRAIRERDISPWVTLDLKARETASTELILEPGTMVTVEVRDAGGPVERCYARVRDETGLLVSSTVLKRGSATLGPLLPGSYRVVATLGSGAPESEQSLTTAGEPAQTVRLSLLD